MKNVDKATLPMKHLEASLHVMKRFDGPSSQLAHALEDVDVSTPEGAALARQKAEELGFTYNPSDLNSFDMNWFRLGKRL